MQKDYNRYLPDKKEKVKFFCICAICLSGAGYIFYGTLLFCLAAPALYPFFMGIYCRKKAEQRKERLLLQFRDFLYSLSASFAAGRHMMDAIEEAEQNLGEIYGNQGEMTEEVCAMVRRNRETGETDLDILNDFAERSHLEDARDFVQVFGACRETGGNLVLAVNKASAVICDKINIETEIRAIVSQKKLEGRIITSMPIIVILFLQLISPDYLSVMYQTLMGRILMTLALSGIAAAYLMIERITAIEV